MRDKARKREYQRNYMRKRREKLRQKQLEEKQKAQKESLSNLDLNVGMKPLKPEFMTFKEYRELFPNASFKRYLRDKIRFQKDSKVRELEQPTQLSSNEKEYEKAMRERSESENIF